MPPQNAGDPGRPEPGPLEGAHILVVDDDECQASTLAALLRDDGASATSMVDGEQALARFAERPLDALVVDIRMPRLDGRGLLAALRVSHPRLPAVLLTSCQVTDARVVDAMSSGNVAYFAKPVDLDALVATLARLISRSVMS